MENKLSRQLRLWHVIAAFSQFGGAPLSALNVAERLEEGELETVETVLMRMAHLLEQSSPPDADCVACAARIRVALGGNR